MIVGEVAIYRCAQPQLLAAHWRDAGEAGTSLAHWQTAANRALELSASPEAVQHVREALPLVSALPTAAPSAMGANCNCKRRQVGY